MKRLLVILLLLASPIVATAQEPVVITDDTPVVVEAPPAENNYWDAVEAWVKSSIGILLAAGVSISASVSTVKTILLAPLRDKTPVLDAEIWNNITLYDVAVLGLVLAISAMSYAVDINPFKNAPVEWVTWIPESVQALATIAMTAYLAMASHEFLDWLKSKTAKG